MKRSILQQLFTLLLVVMAMPVLAQTDGRASYYHNSLHGRTMSNGQPYDRNKFTCAHRTLPFGTKLRITNQSNGKQVIVEVTDRGPFVRGRIIDLSYAAAREIGMIAAGVGSIRVEVLPKDIEIPYQSNGEYDGMPEIEYGMAGVCYEFIPEWSEEKETKTEERRASAPTTQNPQNTSSTQSTPKTQTPPKTQNSQPTKKEGSRGWTDFFNKLKDWGH